MPECIAAVERAFLRHARGEAIPPAVLGVHVESGGFHVKTAGMFDAIDGRPVFAAKVNANFPGNPERHGLPTIQGVIALFDAANGRVLALFDSIEITVLRTAAATAVAAKYLASDEAKVAICGCGEQAEPTSRARVCALDRARDGYGHNAERGSLRRGMTFVAAVGATIQTNRRSSGTARGQWSSRHPRAGARRSATSIALAAGGCGVRTCAPSWGRSSLG